MTNKTHSLVFRNNGLKLKRVRNDSGRWFKLSAKLWNFNPSLQVVFNDGKYLNDSIDFNIKVKFNFYWRTGQWF